MDLVGTATLIITMFNYKPGKSLVQNQSDRNSRISGWSDDLR